jgi:hypothetical protein
VLEGGPLYRFAQSVDGAAECDAAR